MDKRVVLIVGGSGGIGMHLVEQFANAGYEVVYTYNFNNAQAEELLSKGIRGAHLDVRSEESVNELFQLIREEYNRLDALIYTTGIFEDSLIDNCSLESWNNVIEVNLTGAFLLTRSFIRMLRKSGHGRIIYTGSVVADLGAYGSSSYAVTKAGLIALAKSVGLENAKKGVTANVVSLGYINAGMSTRVSEELLESTIQKIPMKRLGDAKDAAKVIVDLCGDHMNYISGQVIRVNGMLYV